MAVHRNKGGQYYSSGAVFSNAFSPREILRQITAWYRADLGITLAAANVSAWADQSGGGHTASQVTDAKRGTVASEAAFNNQMAVSLTATSWYTTGFNLGASSTIIYVGTRSTAASAYILEFASQSGGGILSQFASTGFQIYNGTDVLDMAAIASATAPHVVSVRQIDATSLVCRQDGTQKFSQVPAAALSGKRFSLGDESNGTNGGAVKVAEIIVGNFGTTDIRRCEKYAGNRYAFAVAA